MNDRIIINNVEYKTVKVSSKDVIYVPISITQHMESFAHWDILNETQDTTISFHFPSGH